MTAYDDQLKAMEGYNVMPNPGEQRSPEWLAERVGHCTASRFRDVMDKLKNGNPGAKRQSYSLELVIERITGRPEEHYVNAAMEWGTEKEPLARMAYEALTGAMVLVPGFVHHPTIKMCGGSPDGYVGDDGGVEFKCPTTATHVKQLLSDECDHLPQIQGLMWITGRQWWDYVSYDPRLPPTMQLYIRRIQRDDDYIAELAGNVLQFLSEVDAMRDRLLGVATNSAPAPDSPGSAAVPPDAAAQPAAEPARVVAGVRNQILNSDVNSVATWSGTPVVEPKRK